ncbi:MAG: hypothetical protein AB7I04_04595 [Pseudomonadales bacterium]
MGRRLILLALLLVPLCANAAALLRDVLYQAEESYVDLQIRLGTAMRIESFDAEDRRLTIGLRSTSAASGEWYASELRFEEEGRLLETVSLEGSDKKGYVLTLGFSAPVAAQLLPQFMDTQVLLKLTPEKDYAGMTRFRREKGDDQYAINLESRLKSFPTLADLPKGYADTHVVYITDFEKDGVLWHRLRIGFFAGEREANRTAGILRRYFPDAWIERVGSDEIAFAEAFRLNPPDYVADRAADTMAAETAAATAGGDEVQLSIALTTPTTIDVVPEPEPAPAPSVWTTRSVVEPAPPGEVEAMLIEAREAFAREDWPTAINRYGAVVAANEEPWRQEALEMLGVSRELNDQKAHAKRYYELYLDDYAGDTDAAERVTQRLAALTAFDLERKKPTASAQVAATGPAWDLGVQIGQFYQRQTFTVDDNSSVPVNGLFNDLNFMASRNGGSLDQDVRVTMSYLADFSDNDWLDGRTFQVSAAYWEGFAERLNAGVRIGRQSNWETGALGRFDGADLTYRLSDRIGLGLTGGLLLDASYDAPTSDRPFFGFRGEYLSASGKLALRPFFVQQYADSQLDRQAIGVQGQYYTDRFMLFSLVDYDVHYAALNNLTLTGNVSFGRSQLNASYEHRRNPYLTTRNALMGQTIGDLTEFEETLLDLSLEQIADDRTATSNTLRLGWNQRLGDSWTLSADVVATDFSSTEASADVLGLDAQKTLYSSMQIRSTDIFGRGSYSGLMLRLADSETSDTTSLYWDNRLRFGERWFLYPRFRVDHRNFVRTDDEQWTLRPSLRLDYRFSRIIRFELESGYEWSTRDFADRSVDITGVFLRAGYRAFF